MQGSLFGTEIVLDLETQKSFDEVGGRHNLEALKVSVAGVYDYGKDQYLVFEEQELPRCEELLKTAVKIIGFNIIGFDFRVLAPYMKTLSTSQLPALDIMKEIERKVGHRVSLDSVATATLGTKKTGHGLDALKYFRDGNMAALKEYCLQDVKLTKELYDHGRHHRRLSYYSKSGALMTVPLDWS